MVNINRQFEKAYDAHSDAIFRHCYFRVRDRERAKEITQDVFMRTWKYMADGNGIENIRAFLYKTALNLVINETQRRKEHTSLETLREETGYEPAQEEEIMEGDSVLYDRMFVELEKLPEQYKLVLVYRYIDGLSVKEIAQMLGEMSNTVSVRLHRAKVELRDRLGKSIYE